MQVFSQDHLIVVADLTAAATPIPINFPGRALLTRVAGYNTDSGAGISIDLYSRAFASGTVPIDRIVDDGNGKVKILTLAPLPVKVGDLLTVASSTVSGYNSATAHRVTFFDKSSDRVIVTGVNFTAEGVGGTVQWTVPTAERLLYKIGSTLTASAGNVISQDYADTGVPFVNMDPIVNKGYNRKLHVKFSAAGTYRLVLTGRLTGPT